MKHWVLCPRAWNEHGTSEHGHPEKLLIGVRSDAGSLDQVLTPCSL